MREDNEKICKTEGVETFGNLHEKLVWEGEKRHCEYIICSNVGGVGGGGGGGDGRRWRWWRW